jgi:hypothetical protein
MKNKSVGMAVAMFAITLCSFAQQPKTTAKSATSIDKTSTKKTQPAGLKNYTSVAKPKQVLISYWDTESGLYGFKDSISDKVVVMAKYTSVNPFSCGLAAVNTGGEMTDNYDYSDTYCIGGKWGFINSKGIVIVPLKYDDVRDFSDGMAAVNTGGIVEYDDYNDESFFSGGKWGFINSAGLVVVPVKYDEVQSFSGGFGNVILGGKAGCVGKAGQTIIPIKYSGISTVNKGTAMVWNTDSTYTSRFGLVNTKGMAITPLAFEELDYTEDGIYKAKKDELWGLINSAGKTIVPFRYSEIDHSCGYFIVTVDGLKGLLDKTGKEIYPPVNKYITQFDDDGFMIIEKDEHHFSDFHKSGLKFDRKNTFEGNVARVVLNGKYGLINKKAQIILPYKYDEIGYFNDTLAIAKLNGKQGYITITGKELIPCLYDEIGLIEKNLIWVKLGTKQGYISTQGKEIIPIRYDEILEPYTGREIQRVKINEKYGIINKNLGENNELIPPKFDFILDYGGDVLKSNIGGVKNSEGYVNGGKWGIINKQSGLEVIAPKYDYIWEYLDGLALVIVGGIFDPVRKSFVGGKYGFINLKGAEVIPIQFDVANPFKDGVASVTLNGVSYKINVNGERVY